MEGKLKRLIPSLIIALTSVILQLAGKHFYFDTNSIPYDHFLYTFTHANIFHLSLNLIALFQFKPRVKTCLIGYVSCVLASFVPLASMPLPTCGMSGFIMGCYARRYHAYKLNLWRIILSNIVMAFIPLFNWRIHLLSFLIAYIIYGVIQKISVHGRG